MIAMIIGNHEDELPEFQFEQATIGFAIRIEENHHRLEIGLYGCVVIDRDDIVEVHSRFLNGRRLGFQHIENEIIRDEE